MNKKVAAIGVVILLVVGLWSIAAPQPQDNRKGGRGVQLSQPRIAPLTETEWTDEQRKELEPFYREGQLYNVVGTLARHWEAYKKFLVWGRHVLGDTSTLPPRERELLILRTGWLCHAEYEWGQHVVIGKKAGLTDAEIARIKDGPEAAGWAPFDATLLRAADELCTRRPSSAMRPGRPCVSGIPPNSSWTRCSRWASTPWCLWR